jgi:DHA2 family multidrug resistance protein
MHQNDLGAHLDAANPVLQIKTRMMALYLGHHTGGPGARPGAYGEVYGQLIQQSALIAYMDVFRWTALLAFFCAASVWLFRKPQKHAAPPPGAH